MSTDSIKPAPRSVGGPGRFSATVFAIPIILVGGTLLLSIKTTEVDTRSESGVIMNLPDKVGPFVGREGEISEAERVILPKDTEFARKIYTDSQNDQIMASIVLSGAEKRSIHRPEICLPGQGWTIGGSEVISIMFPSGHKLDVMNLSLSREVEIAPGESETIRAYFMYWFVGENRTTPYHLTRMLSTSWDRVVKHVNHRWAYVIVSSTITDNLRQNGLDAEETLTMMKNFVAQSAPTFQKDLMPKS